MDMEVEMRGRLIFRSPRGFTLLELMIVIAIIGITSAIVIPNFLATKPLRNLKTATRDVFGDFMLAKSRAASRYQAHFVCFDIDAGQFWTESGDQPRAGTCACTPCTGAGTPCTPVGNFRKNLPVTVNFESVNGVVAGGGSIVSEGFNVDGTAGAGNVTITNSQGARYRVTVANTGRLQMSKL
jgi:prepilin-type N-terminal cleavage/methylation domain-containing protein